MPVKNTGAYLDACISSIRNQSFSDWELIAINDHSSDHSSAILKKWSLIDPRIHYYDALEKGIISALKQAFAHARGQFIHRMDSDDLMVSSKLEKLMNGLSKAELSTAKVKYFAQDLQDGYKKYESWINDRNSLNFWSDIYYECVLPSPCWLMNRVLFEQYLNHPELRYPEDYFLALFLYARKTTVCSLPDYLHLWRDHTTRASRNDPNYLDQSFLDIKTSFFLHYDYDPSKNLLIWGAGKKGKALVKKLIDRNIPFTWITNNPKKIGVNIYGKFLENADQYSLRPDDTLVLLALSNPEDKYQALKALENQSFRKGQQLFPFF